MQQGCVKTVTLIAIIVKNGRPKKTLAKYNRRKQVQKLNKVIYKQNPNHKNKTNKKKENDLFKTNCPSLINLYDNYKFLVN